MPTENQPDGKASPEQSSLIELPIAGAAEKTAALPPASPYIGVQIKDRYRIERELGRGGFGAVYLARDEQLSSRPVVIKVLLDRTGESEWFLKKFREEREALARIDHPGVVGVLDAGEMPDGKPFLVMQFVDGQTLRAALKKEEFSLPRIAHIVRKVGQALGAAHDRGVYHRDLKPENIMLQDLGEGEELVKIIDFGIATVRSSSGGPQAEATRVAGTGPYMAPEQIMGSPSAASDVYALGVIAYEMVTGRCPFQSESVTQMYLLQKEGIPVKPRELCPDLPPAAEDCILKALCFEQNQRYARVREFGEEFARSVLQGSGAIPSDSQASPVSRQPTASVARSKSGSLAAGSGASSGSQQGLEVAHLLFMDVVGYSLLPMDRQTQVLQHLQELVSNTAEFRRAQASGELLSLPTGDGMSLVFFRDLMAPVQCAVELCRALRSVPEIKLRIGVHSGPVFRVADINANLNVAGGGINMAQRVMDSGDAGHILLSRSVAETLMELSQWAPHVHDLGEQEVKHGVRIHLFNLYTDEVGNPEIPRKCAGAKTSARRKAGKRPLAEPKKAARTKLAVIGSLTMVAVLAVVGFFIGINRKPSQPATPAPALPERMFSYHIVVQRFRDGQPYREPFVLPGEMIFQSDYRVRLVVTSPQAGHLYVLNEGPTSSAGVPSFNILFPGSGEPASLAANQTIQIPAAEKHWIVFDEQEGTEKLWMVWSVESVEALEAAKAFGESEHQGMIADPGLLRSIQMFLNQRQASPPSVKRDDEKAQTIVRGQSDVIVRLINLEHH